MAKNILLTGLMAVMTVGAIAIGRYPRPRVEPPARFNHPVEASRPDALANIKADLLIPANNAPSALEFADGTWINSDPLTLEKLRGRVVVVEFWTFGCYNCRNTLPSMKDWDTRYRDRGLTIIGVHTPETSSEYTLDNLRREVPSLEIKYPVLTDNEYQTWKAYNVEAWPTIFVLDKQGRIRWLHVGEGRYQETENVFKALLAE